MQRKRPNYGLAFSSPEKENLSLGDCLHVMTYKRGMGYADEET